MATLDLLSLAGALREEHHLEIRSVRFVGHLLRSLVRHPGNPAGRVGDLHHSISVVFGELDRHFRAEEQDLFPALAGMVVGREEVLEGLRREHGEFRDGFSRLLEILAREPCGRDRLAEVRRLWVPIVRGLRSHVRREEPLFRDFQVRPDGYAGPDGVP